MYVKVLTVFGSWAYVRHLWPKVERSGPFSFNVWVLSGNKLPSKILQRPVFYVGREDWILISCGFWKPHKNSEKLTLPFTLSILSLQYRNEELPMVVWGLKSLQTLNAYSNDWDIVLMFPGGKNDTQTMMVEVYAKSCCIRRKHNCQLPFVYGCFSLQVHKIKEYLSHFRWLMVIGLIDIPWFYESVKKKLTPNVNYSLTLRFKHWF